MTTARLKTRWRLWHLTWLVGLVALDMAAIRTVLPMFTRGRSPDELTELWQLTCLMILFATPFFVAGAVLEMPKGAGRSIVSPATRD